MEHDLAHWVQGCRGRRVLLVGDLILDRYIYGDAERISPEAPVPVLRVVERREAVGGAANVAACLRALGCDVAICGMMGSDRHGQTLIRLLEELGVDITGVTTHADRPTTTKTRLVGLAQHRHRQQLMRVDEEETQSLCEDAAAHVSRTACARIADADVVCVEDYDKGLISGPLVQALIAEAHRRSRRVLVDPARLKSYDRYRGADVVTPNRDELSRVSGRSCDSTDAAASAGQAILETYDLRAVVATLDRDGALLIERGRGSEHWPTVPRTVYDNTGAGDAVLAMLAAAVAAGADLAGATRLANIAGGLEVEKFGCVPITADEVLAELRLEHRLRNGKLSTVEELLGELQLRRDRGETVAFTNGCFDILHAGHVDFLQRCRREASLLVVGLNSDSSVRRLNKGEDRPVNAFEHRAAVLGALECVDYVVGFEEPDPERLIRQVRPDVLVKGEDWAEKGVVGREFVESTGGRVVLMPLIDGLSTSALIDRIRGGEMSHAGR